MTDDLKDQLATLHEKVDRILRLLEGREQQRQQKNEARRERESKAKQPPPTPEEVAAYQRQFEELFTAWEAGKELEVEAQLDGMDPDELRRFADANNLNVTAKMAKPRVMQLIAARFRERRHLTRPHFQRSLKGE